MQISITSHTSECISLEIFPRGKAVVAWHRVVVLYRESLVIVSAHHRGTDRASGAVLLCATGGGMPQATSGAAATGRRSCDACAHAILCRWASRAGSRCPRSFRRDESALAANACVRGIPYLLRYDVASSPCFLRWRPESCVKRTPHSRHVTLCLVMLVRQLTGSSGVSGVATATMPPLEPSCAFRAKRLLWVCWRTVCISSGNSL